MAKNALLADLMRRLIIWFN